MSKGEGVERDEEKAFLWWMKSAQHGFVLAQSRLGYSYAKGLGVQKNLNKAFKWWTIAAGGGNGVAKRNLEFLCRENPEVCKSPSATE